MVEGGAGDLNDAVGGGNGFAIGKNASPEAIDFVKFLTNAENQKRLAEIGVAIPVVKGGEAGMTDPLMIQLQKQLSQAQYFQLYYDQALPPAMGSVINDSTQGFSPGRLRRRRLPRPLKIPLHRNWSRPLRANLDSSNTITTVPQVFKLACGWHPTASAFYKNIRKRAFICNQFPPTLIC